MQLKKPRRSAGAIALAKCGKTHEEIATRVRASRQVVSMWISGERTPGAPNRKALREAYGIAELLWDAPPERAPAPPKPGPGIIAAAPRPTRQDEDDVEPFVAKRERLERLLEQDMAKLEQDTDMSSLERAKVMASMGKTLEIIGKMTGETLNIPESKVLHLPAWRRIESAIVTALTPWPEAMRAAGDALKSLSEY